jgi:hypothetical protein
VVVSGPAAPDPATCRALGRVFGFAGELLAAAPHGAGHIHDTYLVRFERGPAGGVAILQRLNLRVFPDPARLMENIVRVTAHQRVKLAGEDDAERRALRVLPAADGSGWWRDAAGAVWRAYAWIPGTRPPDALDALAEARQAALAFARFQRQLADLAPPRLHETIPDFHHTPKRFAAFAAAVAADGRGRAAGAAAEIEYAGRQEPLAGALLDAWRRGLLVERVTHNDTKLDNVLFDARDGRALCVIDLDTVMPGLPLWDFGDMVRSASLPVEDERDPARLTASVEVFGALAAGYVEGLGEMLLPAERERLALAGQLLVYECGLRFLTDHLQGDVYFRIHRPDQNLDRARAHFAMLRSLLEREEALQRLVQSPLPPGEG